MKGRLSNKQDRDIRHMERYEIWIFIFMLGLLGFNWPFLEIFYTETVRYLFSFWLIFIAIIAFVAYKSKKDIENR